MRTVLVVVVVEEDLAERPSVLDGPEALGERGAVLEGLELRPGVGVVVALLRGTEVTGLSVYPNLRRRYS